ncbi:hypothetical protein GCM10008967_36850 [Bacillus carboniphilus]|uniref:Thymidylate kinase n=1 Tax=Bacillus carboniphilus TaxID=86663 RepID=A0ABN0WNX3_9BACI
MNSKLILVEGLPGSGKSTTARLFQEILIEEGIKNELYIEGNLDHPADYDAVSFFTEDEWLQLLNSSCELKEALVNNVEQKDNGYFLSYGKMIYRQGIKIPDALFNRIFKHDIYELPLEKNIELITNRWANFASHAIQSDTTYIFECCFIQNPVTVGMLKYNATKTTVMNYVQGLEEAIVKLNPIVVYVDQADISHSFGNAVKERPKEWFNGFVEYYTGQGFGKVNGYEDYEGTLKVLEARKELEAEIFHSLKVEKVLLDNSAFNKKMFRKRLVEIVKESI